MKIICGIENKGKCKNSGIKKRKFKLQLKNGNNFLLFIAVVHLYLIILVRINGATRDDIYDRNPPI